VGKNGGEGRLAEAGGTVEEDVRQRFLELADGIEEDAEPLDDALLADHLAQIARPKSGIPGRVVRTAAASAADDGFASHAVFIRREMWGRSVNRRVGRVFEPHRFPPLSPSPRPNRWASKTLDPPYGSRSISEAAAARH